MSKWASAWDFQQCGMCNQQSLRSACAYAQSYQSRCLSLEYSMSVKLLTEHPLEFLSLKRGCTGLSESWVYTCQNATLLEITCHGSNYFNRSRYCDCFQDMQSKIERLHSYVRKFSQVTISCPRRLAWGSVWSFLSLVFIFPFLSQKGLTVYRYLWCVIFLLS